MTTGQIGLNLGEEAPVSSASLLRAKHAADLNLTKAWVAEIEGYIERREITSDLVSAVLANDLYLALKLATAKDLKNLKPLTAYVQENVPVEMMGSHHAVAFYLSGSGSKNELSITSDRIAPHFLG